MPLAVELACRRDDVLPLTRALVAAASPSPPGDERAAAAVVDQYLSGVSGVARDLICSRPERPNLVYSTGDGDRTLTFAAHLDTYAIVGSWRYDPLGELAGDRLYGRGTTDNKGAVAAMAAVFRAAAERGLPDGMRLVLIANADEEFGGAEGIAVVCREYALPLGAVVVAEPSGVVEPWEALYVAARGTSRFSLAATGVRTHSSLAGRDDAPSAVEALEEALHAVRARLAVLGERHPRFGLRGRLTVVRIDGGDGYGVVPSRARAEVELRLVPGSEQAAIERELQDIVAHLPVELTFADGALQWMAPSEISVDHPLVGFAADAWRDVLGAPPALACFPGGTDARLFAEAGWAALAGVGPGALVRAHHPDEYVTTGELDTAVRLYAAIAAHFAESEEPR